jgi:hypothetical protein
LAENVSWTKHASFIIMGVGKEKKSFVTLTQIASEACMYMTKVSLFK